MPWQVYNSAGQLLQATDLPDNAVTNAKVADDAIDSAEIATGAIDTAHIAGSQITNALMADDAIGVAELSATGTASSSTFLRGDNTWAAAGGGSGVVKQFVSTQTGASATGTTTIPHDDTIPQSSEGTEFMTLAITPNNASNRLIIETTLNGSPSSARWLTVALFQDSTAGALAVAHEYVDTGTGATTVTFSHVMAAGTTSATTFKVRAGTGAGSTFTFNGMSAGRMMGGVMASGIRILEVEP